MAKKESSSNSAQHSHGPMNVAQKPKNFKKSLKRMAIYGKSYATWLIISVVFAVIGTTLNLIGPNIIGKITDIIFGAIDSTRFVVNHIDMGKIMRFVAILSTLYLIGFVLSYAQKYIMSTITQRYTRKMRSDVSVKINKVPLNYFDNTTYGDILSRVTNDADTVADSMHHCVASLVTNITMVVGCLVMMFAKSWILTLSILATTILGFSLMRIIITKSQKFFVAQQKYLGKLNGHIEEAYSGQQVINVYNAKDESKSKFTEYNEKLYKSAWKSQFMSGLMMPIMSFIGKLGNCVVCVLGVILAVKGQMTFGDVTAYLIYVSLFTNPLSQIAQAVTQVQTMVASGERVFELLDEKELADESNKTLVLKDINGQVEFKNVKFGYAEDKEIIHNFSAKVKPGEKVAIVGKTGAGKTTLVNLLMRFYEINGGKILIDGVDTKQLTRDNVHDLFSMVLQDSWLYEASVMENIKYNNQDIPDEKVYEACRVCGIDNFIRTLPNSYNTILDDNTTISAGQKQLVTIARAMLQNNPMLILDEATSSVDTRTELLIQHAMDKLTKGRTSFVIAHRLSTIKNADVIFVLDNGDIVESGNHKELLAKNGVYSQLYNSQFEEV